MRHEGPKDLDGRQIENRKSKQITKHFVFSLTEDKHQVIATERSIQGEKTMNFV